MSSYEDKQAAAAVDDAPGEDQAGNAPHNGPQVRRFSWLYFTCFVGAFGLAKCAGHTFECVSTAAGCGSLIPCYPCVPFLSVHAYVMHKLYPPLA